MDENDNAYDEKMVDIAIKMDSFLGTDVGKNLVQRAQVEIDSLRDELEDTISFEELRKMQNEIKVRRFALQWIQDILTQGQMSADQLQVAEAMKIEQEE